MFFQHSFSCFSSITGMDVLRNKTRLHVESLPEPLNKREKSNNGELLVQIKIAI